MFEFLSSPFGLVAVGLGVLAVAVLALCLWITTLDRRMRGMADGLETERRKVAELQMAIGRRANAARSYGHRGRVPAPGSAPADAPVGASSGMAAAPMAAATAPAAAPVGAPAAAVPGNTAMPPRAAAAAPTPSAAPMGAAAPARATAPARGRAPRPASATGGWTPNSIPMPAQAEVDAWVQGAPGAQPIVMPDRKMSRKARREAERAFAARAAAELEARQARRAQEAAAAQRASSAVPARAAARGANAAGVPAAGFAGAAGRGVAPSGVGVGPGVPAQAQGFAPVQPGYEAPAGGRGRHAR